MMALIDKGRIVDGHRRGAHNTIVFFFLYHRETVGPFIA